jgi:hypothetical protein
MVTGWPAYPCLGGCGTEIPLGPGTCLECWRATKTYAPEEVRMLPATDYRRQRTRDPRDRRRQRPSWGRAR